MSEQSLKTISLHFAIPANIDTPSETLAEMKALVVSALCFYRANLAKTFPSPEDKQWLDALLTES